MRSVNFSDKALAALPDVRLCLNLKCLISSLTCGESRALRSSSGGAGFLYSLFPVPKGSRIGFAGHDARPFFEADHACSETEPGVDVAVCGNLPRRPKALAPAAAKRRAGANKPLKDKYSCRSPKNTAMETSVGRRHRPNSTTFCRRAETGHCRNFLHGLAHVIGGAPRTGAVCKARRCHPGTRPQRKSNPTVGCSGRCMRSPGIFTGPIPLVSPLFTGCNFR